jgi:hypothetical protein
MHALDDFVAAQGNRHRLEVFDGPHRWMPEPLARQAVEWMELQAMVQGRRPRDEAVIDRLYAADLAAARALVAAGRKLDGLSRLRAVAHSFEGLCDVSEPRHLADELAASPEVVREIAERSRWLKYEEGYVEALYPILFQYRGADPAPSAKRLAADLSISELRRHAKRQGHEGTTGRRLLQKVFVNLSFYMTRDLLRNELFSHAEGALEVATLIENDNALVWYNLACARARAGHERAALEALERSVECGFDDLAHIRGDEDLEAIRSYEEYRDLLARLSAGSKLSRTRSPRSLSTTGPVPFSPVFT